ncbi:L-arabinose isomerase [Pediococcus acidilactici]|uniref:L-arabinose isomerase n=1 Tax=Pediococcus acidilactici TaxID=1254 RepID=UPI0013630219|nr:L-arabinose isomerase [Pediococcus acidilactici]NBI15794.1 L-arabinose isomerase [Pediococcus acidilactici]NFA46313.1 L-arabinose isomerase [Pediococcus acidilactici]NFA47851.1 L-arabinose isomerase [Pediococcus acidilactici]NFA89011.1 L-arabinose isomerase [Pediococcus acidilactici]NFB09974.1 L-arabinose isomerase [Pediococcus acidilactici]
MKKMQDYEFWFITGSQFLYGEETLRSVEKDARKIVDKLNESKNLPYPVKFKLVATTAENITQVMKDANYNDKVAGVITWMHTFSPAKNWIRGTKLLQKPLLHLATQFLNHIPYDTIDFDYMNLNQSAHGDREYAFINARLRKNNKIITGYWGDEDIQKQIAKWMDASVGYNESFGIKVVTFADKMRNVAVTDGDKIEAQIKFGWTVDYWGVADLVEEVNAVAEDDINNKYEEMKKEYNFVEGENSSEKFEHNTKYQIREYFALKKFMDDRGYTAFTTNFEDLAGLEQLPGLAVQMLMAEGYGFAGEGDWKTAALDRLMKIIAHNQHTAFMEDYTLDLRKGHEAILGSHMLEVDPTLASDTPRVEVHPLDIGGKDDPARFVFTGMEGDAVDVTMADYGDEFKLMSYDVQGNKPEKETPHLPVAKQLWTPKQGWKKGAEGWLTLGGGHHTVLSFNVDAEQLQDLSNMFGLTYVNIK